VRQGRDTVDDERAGQGAQRVQALGGQGDATHEPQQGTSADHTGNQTDAHLQDESGGHRQHAPGGDTAGCQQRDHQGDADRVVRAGLALQDVTAAACDLASTQHGEHHRRVRGRHCGTQQRGQVPVESERPVREHGSGRRGQEGADHADHGDRGRGPSEP